MGKGETGDKYSLRYIGSESYSADPWSPEFALKFLVPPGLKHIGLGFRV